MKIPLQILADAIYADVDAALDAGWTPRHWEAHVDGFPGLVAERIKTVGDLRVVAAGLGAIKLIRQLEGIDGNEYVTFFQNYTS